MNKEEVRQIINKNIPDATQMIGIYESSSEKFHDVLCYVGCYIHTFRVYNDGQIKER